MKIRNIPSNFLRSSLLSFGVIALCVMNTSCQNNSSGGLRVAGGEFDADGSGAKYPATVYTEIQGKDLNDQAAIIRNVGTIVDVGLSDSYALILSLADVFQPKDGGVALPIMKEVNLKLFLSSGNDAIDLPAMKLTQAGHLEDLEKRKYFMMTVGVKAERTGKIPSQASSKVTELSEKLLLESPLNTASGVNLRDSNTSYILLSLPKSSHPALGGMRVPKIMVAEDRPAPSEFKGIVAGFGENTVAKGSKRNEFSLSDALPNVMKRNFAPITALNKKESDFTPLRRLIGSSTNTAQQIWEFTGSGLCGSSDGRNYDTGASIYAADGRFAGFGVRSTAKSAGFKGNLNCAATTSDDMVTLVVSPSREHISQFVSRAQ